jgi:cytidine deaminase
MRMAAYLPDATLKTQLTHKAGVRSLRPIAALIAAGGKRVSEVAVMGNGDALCTPCGGCRQKIREFASGDVKIHCCTEDGDLIRTFTLQELLPYSFGPENLL